VHYKLHCGINDNLLLSDKNEIVNHFNVLEENNYMYLEIENILFKKYKEIENSGFGCYGDLFKNFI